MMRARILFTSLLILHYFILCGCKDTITINETFKDGDLLISKEQKFALGFFSRGLSGSSRRYLGIWFHMIPGQTVVWVANRNNPINSSSGVLSINQEGNLVLYDENNPVWWTNGSVKGQTCQLLDSGNLVVVQGENKRIWQSFDHPTNTFLPGMTLGFNKKTGENRFLSSWRSATDPGTGNYSHRINPSGSPQIFLYNGAQHYWRSCPWPWKSFKEVYDVAFDENEDEIWNSFSFHDKSIITRIILHHSGVLKWQTWNENDGQWKEFLSIPKERCDYHGRCGAYGKCDSNMVNRFECSCLPGYEPKSPRDWKLWDGRDGCVRKRKESSSVCRHGEGFIKVDSLKLPDTRAAVWVDKSMSLMDCEQECRMNCSCSAYSSIVMAGNATGCLFWYGELIDTITFISDIGHDLYVRVDATELATYGIRSSSSFLKSKGALSIMIISVVSGWMIIVFFIYFCLRRRKKHRTTKKNMLFNPIKGLKNYEDALAAANELEGRSRGHQDLVFFDLRSILAATDNFSAANKIGKGGFGTVYKGQLTNGQDIAIKRMSNTSRQGIEELRNEVMLIAKLQHNNLVKLIGCCIEKKEQMLIYEYLPNKSLDTFLFDERKRVLLDWETRFNIIGGIARGILYLHQDSRLKIIHRDLKSSNILLDATMNPKISDFGTAKLFKSDQIQDKTARIIGTYGYMSPEYAMFGKFSVKSDVFAFGVILLEIISGKRSSSFNQIDPSLSLIGYVWGKWKEDEALEMVDSLLIKSYNSYEVLRCIQVGLLCVQEISIDRPTMLDVVLMLKSEMPLPSPKQPAFILGASSSSFKPSPVEERSCSSVNDVTITDLVTR